MKMFLLTVMAFVGLMFSVPALALPTSPQAVAVVAHIERSTALDTLVGIAQQEYNAKLLDEADVKSVTTLVTSAAAAIDAKDYVTADARLADLAQFLHDHSEPRQKT